MAQVVAHYLPNGNNSTSYKIEGGYIKFSKFSEIRDLLDDAAKLRITLENIDRTESPKLNVVYTGAFTEQTTTYDFEVLETDPTTLDLQTGFRYNVIFDVIEYKNDTSDDGATGPTGSAGIDGATGPTGSAGVQGTTGPTGNDGAAGDAGLDGATGPTGSAGVQGATGPAAAITYLHSEDLVGYSTNSATFTSMPNIGHFVTDNGTYFVTFSGIGRTDAVNAYGDYCILLDGVVVNSTFRRINCWDAAPNFPWMTIYTDYILVVTTPVTVTVGYRAFNGIGQFIVGDLNLTLLKIA